MGLPFELKIKNFGGVEVSRKTADRYTDGRPLFHIPPECTPMECVDRLPNGDVVKGHAISEDGIEEILSHDCQVCRRRKGRHVRKGEEVRAWLRQMPDACVRWWKDQGCDGGGFIPTGGDDVQGYGFDCPGCARCSGEGETKA